ncbi:hypothetical protein TVAG_220750 [Trichomonas vaginalis G3]|uniref:Glycosyltransferase 61 catalytic domain-containing protein n=1 Tax=Trichomonas vaginalis (strain ATCC PRA-98 / G3) TaxID=412133 RepID=A2FQU3_TRIV3|nr:glycosyltransferase family [Trichomonas vaginalis G3]EAX92712.1 hypothetical protein TVAG_220750 [Trichomonas vaginalis G3]KAI5517969.1 glycosyltransferase family [Trichomonas vaginalis G3]|eukprot:XP_001305642.1 hypothetical protein [Trichomonas vaginalis G3]
MSTLKIKIKQPFIECLDKFQNLNPDSNKILKIQGIKEGLFPEYLDQLIPLHLNYENPPVGNFFGFLKNSERLPYKKYFSNLSLAPLFRTKRTIDIVTTFKGKIAIYKDAYANQFGEFVINNYIIRPPYDSSAIYIREFHEGPVVFECDKACVFGHIWMYNFGHFIDDCLAPLAIVPEDFLEDCVVILSELSRKFGEDVLKAIGVRKYIYLANNTWVHANKLAVAVEGRPHLMHFGIPIQKLVYMLRIYFKVSNIKPTKYAIMNRDLKTRRHITNIKELMIAIKSNITGVKFEEIEDKLGTIESYAKFYPSIKCVLLPTGSNAVKTIFMNPNTVVIIASNEMFDYSVICSILSVHVKVVYFFQCQYHFNDITIDVELAIQAIEVGVYASIHGNFPQPKEFISFIDYMPKHRPIYVGD